MRVVASISADTDLGATGKAVSAANTPHKSQSPPGLALVLFAKLDKDSAESATEALGKVKGIDGKGTKVNAKKGEISVQIAGGEKLTLADILKTLKDAGIEARAVKAKKG